MTTDPPLFQLFNEIGIIEQLARTRFEDAQADGLKIAHFTMLNHLVRVGDGRTPVAMARAFQVTKGAITNTVQRLEERGFVRVEPDPHDGRGKRVWLTDAGRARRLAAIEAAAAAFTEIEALFPAEQATAVLPTLQKLRWILDQARDTD